MSETKLKNAPLKEVIFELHWECIMDNGGMQIDTGFDLAQGKFADKLKAEFPIHRKLIPDGIPFKVFGAPLHQYWRGEFKWPVIQHGQGMIAINEVEQGYEWGISYKPLVIETINFNIQQSFELPDSSIMNLNISNGLNNQNQNKSVVWTTTIEKESSATLEQLVQWIEDAHTSTSNMFKNMLNKSFYASLDK